MTKFGKETGHRLYIFIQKKVAVNSQMQDNSART